ncbi:alpha-xenorhabdolysin family binary toxin subunit B [Pseudomonas frederiksbergensis]|uniref:alpha-xenorhabdolysin family binary toxin subunit B n=1 Tax=Pseudomonas frederiksbergensis TaxID=104087 RepID=UPI0012EBF811
MQRSLNNIDVFFDKTQTIGFGVKLEEDIKYAKARESDFMLQMSELQEIQNNVDKAIKLIESKGIELIGNDVNLTIDKLKSINMTMPEIELVMMAIDQLKKTIEGIVRDVSFLFLLAQSKLLREKIDVLRVSIAEQVKLVIQCEGKIKLIGAIHNIDAHCGVYKTHYEPAVDAFALFGSSIGHGSTVVPVDTFFAEADKFIEFLKPLSIPLK